MYTHNQSVTHFNDILSKGVVVVGIDDIYTDNNGHEVFAYIYDGVICERVKYMSGYTPYTTIFVDASHEQIIDAGFAYAHNNKNMSLSNMRNLFESVVILKGSKKARNNVPLNVLGWDESYYSNYHRRTVPARVFVYDKETDERVWVSYNCVNRIVRTEFPVWYERAVKLQKSMLE